MRFVLSLFTLLIANAVSGTSDITDEPRLYSNVSLNADQGLSENLDLNLAARALVCPIGYSTCVYDSTRCCPIGGHCCGNGYCADIGETCCTGGGTCSVGYKCCGGQQGCAPIGAECCSDGTYCRAGKTCRTYLGEKICCALSGCIGENDSGSDDAGITVPTLTQTATATSTYLEVDWEYYYTTIYWTYWYYYWTSYAPYTVKTVTSTRTTTTTIWSVYATNSLEATVDLISSSREYTFSAPYTATSLRSSSEPVTLSTASAAPTSTLLSGDGPASGSGDAGVFADSPGGAICLSISRTGLLAAVLVAAIGGLAFVL